MAFDWFRVDSDVVDHPKVLRLAIDLGDQNAGWYVIRLWSWLTRYAPRGRLRKDVQAAAETAAGWRGEPGALLRKMIEVELLDAGDDGVLEAHDWWEKQGPLVEKANKDADRQRKRRRALSRGRSADGPTDVPRDGAGTGRDETRRDGRDTTGRDETDDPPTAEQGDLQIDVPRREGPPAPKKVSWHLEVFGELQKTRTEKLTALGLEPEPDKDFSPAFIAKTLATIRDRAGGDQLAVLAAFDRYLGEGWPAQKSPPYTFQVFASEKVWGQFLDTPEASA